MHLTTEMSQMKSLTFIAAGRLVVVVVVDPSMYPVQILGAQEAVVYLVMGKIWEVVVTFI